MLRKKADQEQNKNLLVAELVDAAWVTRMSVARWISVYRQNRSSDQSVPFHRIGTKIPCIP